MYVCGFFSPPLGSTLHKIRFLFIGSFWKDATDTRKICIWRLITALCAFGREPTFFFVRWKVWISRVMDEMPQENLRARVLVICRWFEVRLLWPELREIRLRGSITAEITSLNYNEDYKFYRGFSLDMTPFWGLLHWSIPPFVGLSILFWNFD